MIPAMNPIRAKNPIILVLGLILSHLASNCGSGDLNLTNTILFTARRDNHQFCTGKLSFRGENAQSLQLLIYSDIFQHIRNVEIF